MGVRSPSVLHEATGQKLEVSVQYHWQHLACSMGQEDGTWPYRGLLQRSELRLDDMYGKRNRCAFLAETQDLTELLKQSAVAEHPEVSRAGETNCCGHSTKPPPSLGCSQLSRAESQWLF